MKFDVLKLKRGLCVSIAAVALTACSTTLPVNYVPSPSVRGSGVVDVGSVTYRPAEQGLVKNNQFQKATGAIGQIYLSSSVQDTFKSALKKELLASGYSAGDGNNLVIDAQVNRFLYDWIGIVEVDFYMDVDFVVKKNNVVVLRHKASSHQAAPKTMVQDTEAIKSAMSECISSLLLEARSKNIL